MEGWAAVVVAVVAFELEIAFEIVFLFDPVPEFVHQI